MFTGLPSGIDPVKNAENLPQKNLLLRKYANESQTGREPSTSRGPTPTPIPQRIKALTICPYWRWSSTESSIYSFANTSNSNLCAMASRVSSLIPGEKRTARNASRSPPGGQPRSREVDMRFEPAQGATRPWERIVQVPPRGV